LELLETPIGDGVGVKALPFNLHIKEVKNEVI